MSSDEPQLLTERVAVEIPEGSPDFAAWQSLVALRDAAKIEADAAKLRERTLGTEADRAMARRMDAAVESQAAFRRLKDLNASLSSLLNAHRGDAS